MSRDVLIFIFAVGLVALCILIRYVITRLAHKGADAIQNAIKDKKNKEASGETENLADRYK